LLSARGILVRIPYYMTQALDRTRTLIEMAERPSCVARAIRDLSDTDLLRLRALAALRARGLPGGITWSDLLNEAVLRALDGSRRWSPDVPLVAFLAGIMRSLSSEYWHRSRREVVAMRSLHDDDGGAAQWHALVSASDPERAVAAAEMSAAIDRLFAADAMALRIIAGLANGLTAAEIRRLYGLDEVDYDTIRRRMRRTLVRHGLTGSRQ